MNTFSFTLSLFKNGLQQLNISHKHKNSSWEESIEYLSDKVHLFKIRAANPAFGDENRRKLGFPLASILSCRFGGKPCVYTEDFSWYYSFDFGNCWQFNAGQMSSPIKMSATEGVENGLQLEIGGLIGDSVRDHAVSRSDGLVVFVHNQSYAPESASGIYVRAGQESNVAVQKIFYFNAPFPYTECRDMRSFKSELSTKLRFVIG